VVSAAHRALQLNPRLAQPHVALAITHWYAYKWDSAEVEFKAAIDVDAHDVEARIQYGRHLRYLGRDRESMEQMQFARADDPASAVLLSHIAYNHYLNDQLDSATVVIGLALEYDPNNYTSLANGALIHIRANRLEEARALVARMALQQGIVGYLRARTGDRAGARQYIKHFDVQIPQSAQGHTSRALAYLGLGDTTKALDGLEAATKAHEIWHVMRSVNDPIFDPIRESARFTALQQSVGLPVSAATRRSQN
jgi:Tfp pilus assembly protein PilF